MTATEAAEIVSHDVAEVRGALAFHDTEAGRGAATEEELKAISKVAGVNLSAEDVYVFDCIPSTSRMDSYFTRMSKSTLRNYARDAKAGVAVMNSHRTGGLFAGSAELPVGRSFTGSVEQSGDDLIVTSSAYIVRGVHLSEQRSDDIIRGIETGIVRDISVGFAFGEKGWYRCGVCGKNLFDQKCKHMPGWPTEEGEMAWAWIEDAILREYSLVYKGATPGAVISKAQRLAAEGQFTRSEINRVEEMIGVRLSGVTTFTPKSERIEPEVITEGPERGEEGATMTVREFIEALAQRDDLGSLADDLASLSETLSDESEAGATADRLAELIDAHTERVTAERETALQERVSHLEGQIDALTPAAEDGRAYRAALIKDALAWGVRAKGDAFDEAFWNRLLSEPDRSVGDIEAFVAQFKQEASDRLGKPGRHSNPVDPNDPIGLGQVPQREFDSPAAEPTLYTVG